MRNIFPNFDEERKIFVKKPVENEIEPLSAMKGEAIRLTINEKMLNFFLFVFFLFFIAIFIRLFSLQIIEKDYWLKVAERNEARIEEILPNRGIIYDRNTIPLVKNVPKFSLYLIPKNFPKERKEEIFKKLKEIIKEIPPLNEENQKDKILIKDNLTLREAILFEINKDFLPGIVLETKKIREYIQGREFSHLLGYTSKVYKEELELGYSPTQEVGRYGLEKYYDKLLSGKPGKKRIEPKKIGGENIVAFEPPKDGENLVLTIDARLQKVLAESLEKWTKTYGGKAGAGIILNPKNGEILAMVSYPFFDNNLFAKGISKEDFEKIVNDPRKPLLFRPLQGEYRPGSTIKMAISLAALEEKVIDEKTTFLSTGGIKVGKWFFSDWKKGGHGLTNLKKAIVESVNTYFYKVGELLGPEKISEYLKKFGFGKKTEVDYPSEKDGFIPTPSWKKEFKNEEWFVGDTYNLSIGHGEIKTTLIQIANLTSAVANEGKIFKPHFLKSETPQLYLEIPLKKENFKLVKDSLREVVISGTARYLNDLKISVAGKTGTVEKGNEKPDSLFTCFAPFEDPEIVITVIVENGGEGSGAAVRITKDVLNWWYNFKQ